MDLTSFVALAVGLLIVLSGYFLFNDVPRLGGSGSGSGSGSGARRRR